MENMKTWQTKTMLEKLDGLRELLEGQDRQMQGLREECNWYKNNYRMLEAALPQPCCKFKDATTTEFIAKLAEETSEVVQEALQLASLKRADAMQTEEADETRAHLAEELTDVKTFCETWLAALGYDAVGRSRVQEAINVKNKARGYW